MQAFLRFQSAVPNRLGRFPGVFAMANGLAREGLLSAVDHSWWRAANDAANAAYVDPSTVDPTCYDAAENAGARSWFKTGAAELLAATREYLRLLDQYGVPWHEIRTNSPGRIVYEDTVQIVAVPQAHRGHWPLGSTQRRNWAPG